MGWFNHQPATRLSFRETFEDVMTKPQDGVCYLDVEKGRKLGSKGSYIGL